MGGVHEGCARTFTPLISGFFFMGLPTNICPNHALRLVDVSVMLHAETSSSSSAVVEGASSPAAAWCLHSDTVVAFRDARGPELTLPDDAMDDDALQSYVFEWCVHFLCQCTATSVHACLSQPTIARWH